MSAELKTCPFCGAAPESERTAFSRLFRIVCPKCEIEMQRVTKESAVTAWNTRAEATQ